MASLDLQQQDDGYLLKKTNKDGTKIEILLSDDDIITLSQSAPNLRQEILSKRHPKSGGVSAVFATVVAKINVSPDTLGEDILLTLVASNDTHTTFALPPEIAKILAERLPPLIGEVESANPTRQ
jgi:hypothetical protein